MGAKTAKKVDLQRLAAALDDFPFAYLITVDEDYRVHTVTVEPTLREAILDIGLIGGRTRKNLAQHADVTLLWPPREPGGYTLIVDGSGRVGDDAMKVVPARAVLHRPATAGAVTKPGCLHDCVPLEG